MLHGGRGGDNWKGSKCHAINFTWPIWSARSKREERKRGGHYIDVLSLDQNNNQEVTKHAIKGSGADVSFCSQHWNKYPLAFKHA